MNKKEEQREIKQVTDWDEMYPGRFVKAGDFKKKVVTLTIERVYAEKMPDKYGKLRFKGVLAFEETELELPLNKTNGLCLKAMFGREVQSWVGKRATFFPMLYDGDLAIRVYGSPDIPKNMVITIDLPHKKPFKMTLKRVAWEDGVKAIAAPQEPEPKSLGISEELEDADGPGVFAANGGAMEASEEGP